MERVKERLVDGKVFLYNPENVLRKWKGSYF
jgi:hypothetical protein